MEISREDLYHELASSLRGPASILTPGSEAEACKNDDKQRNERYPNMIGTAGEMLCQ